MKTNTNENSPIVVKTVADLESLMISTINNSVTIAHHGASNKQKSTALKGWVKTTLSKSLPTMLNMMEETIEALPQGNERLTIGIDSDGNNITKTVKYRDQAKKKMVSAFNSVVTDDKNKTLKKKYATKTIKFESTKPLIKDRKAPPTLAERIEKILGETVDGKGYKAILKTIDLEIIRTEKFNSERLVQDKIDAVNNDIRDKARLLSGMGVTLESQIITIGDMYPAIHADDIKHAIQG